MKTLGIFKTKTHLTELIKEVEDGEEICITNRGKKVAFIVPVVKYYSQKVGIENHFREFNLLKKSKPLGLPEEIIKMKELGKK